MNSFVVGDTEFGVENIEFDIQNDKVNISFTGNEDVFDKLTDDDKSEWGWSLYAPKVYFYDVILEDSGVANITFDSAYECAMYMMEHNPLEGTLKVSKEKVYFTGKVDIMGEIKTVSFAIDID